MKSLINWEELRAISRPPRFAHMSNQEQLDLWSNEAEFYDRIIKMEHQGTVNALACLPITPEDSILDVGCGPGRITSKLALIGGNVTAVDFSEHMIKKCREKIVDYPHVKTVLLDWHKAEPDVTIPRHDIVIASRSIAGEDVKKLSRFAKKIAVLIGWANAPNIPDIRAVLFDSARKSGLTSSSHAMNRDRRLQYNLQYNIVYDLGYEPNITIVPDGFEGLYSTKEEVYADIMRLIRDPEDLDQALFRKNVNRFITGSDKDGYRFFFETRTFVMWWETNPKQFKWD